MQNVSVTAQGSYNYFFYQMLRLVGVDGTGYGTNQSNVENALRVSADYKFDTGLWTKVYYNEQLVTRA